MLCLNNLEPILNLPSKMEKKALLKRSFFCTGEDIKETTNSVPKSEKKKVDKFRICPICRTSNSGFLSWLRNYYSCQYEFRQFNQVLSKARRKLIYSGLRTVLFEFFEAKNLLSLRATLV